MSQRNERESEGKRERSKKSPSRKAQVRIQEQLRAINPVLADPSLFVASSKNRIKFLRYIKGPR